LSSIQKGKKLKKAVTNDRSAPILTADKKGGGGGGGGPPMGGPMMGGPPKSAPAVSRQTAMSPGPGPKSIDKSPSFRGPGPATVPAPGKYGGAPSLPPGNKGSIKGSSGPPPPVQRAPPKKTAIAIYDFRGERSGDLAFRANDVITLLKMEGNWWEGEIRGNVGVFPSNYVQPQ